MSACDWEEGERMRRRRGLRVSCLGLSFRDCVVIFFSWTDLILVYSLNVNIW